jgi:hypothetical protein
MKRFIYQAFTVIMGLVFVLALCSLETLHPLAIGALAVSEGWMIYVLSDVMRCKEGKDDVQN